MCDWRTGRLPLVQTRARPSSADLQHAREKKTSKGASEAKRGGGRFCKRGAEHTHSHTLTRTLTEGHCVPTPHEWSFLWGRKCVFVCDPTWVLIMWQLMITGLFTHTDIMCLTKLRLCVCVCISQTSLYVWVSALKRPFLDFPSLCSEKEKDGPRELYFTCHSKCCISSVTQIWVTEQWYYNKDKLSLWSTVHILSN